MLALNILIYCLDISTNNSLTYIYVRLNLLPVMAYINNIILTNIIYFFTNNNSKIDYSLFSVNMFKSMTLSRLFFMVGFISIFTLAVNIPDFWLKMDNPGPGGSSNIGGDPASIGNPGRGQNPGPGQNPGSGHVGNASTGPVRKTYPDILNPEPDMNTIRAKIQ